MSNGITIGHRIQEFIADVLWQKWAEIERRFVEFEIADDAEKIAEALAVPVEVSAQPVPVLKPSKELRAMVAGIDISELEDDVEEMTEA